jgi:hypothetical protein
MTAVVDSCSVESAHEEYACLVQGVVDVGAMCQVFSNAQDGVKMLLSTADGVPIVLSAQSEGSMCHACPSLCNVLMCPVRVDEGQEAKQEDEKKGKTGGLGLLQAGLLQVAVKWAWGGHSDCTKRLFQLGRCQPDAVVYALSGAEKEICGGSLLLDSKTYIVFDETCTDVHVQDVVFSGMLLLSLAVALSRSALSLSHSFMLPKLAATKCFCCKQ